MAIAALEGRKIRTLATTRLYETLPANQTENRTVVGHDEIFSGTWHAALNLRLVVRLMDKSAV